MASHMNLTTTLDKETFSILDVPGKHTRLVKKAKEKMMGSLDLPVLVADLHRVGQFLRVAFNSLAGYTELQITIRGISYDFTKLCDKSSITVSQFKEASSTVVNSLQGTYQFLIDNLEEMALVTLGSIEEVAGDMSAASKELAEEFAQQSQRVEVTITDIMHIKAKDKNQKAKLEDYERKIAQKKLEAKKSELASMKSKQNYEEAKQLQWKAEKAATSPLRSVANAIFRTVSYGRGNLFDTDKDADMAKSYEEEAEQHRAEMLEEKKERKKALSDMMEFTCIIAECKNDKELKEAAIPALDMAMKGMKRLSVIMLQVSKFWKEMEIQCKSLVTEKTLIDRAMSMPKERRLAVWTNESFKNNAIKYYGKWVAMECVCCDYKDMIRQTQRQLYAYLGEHNSTEESRRTVLRLAIELKHDLAKAQTMIG